MKTLMTIEDIFLTDPYFSIIHLTLAFEDKENGLARIHYRWALIPDHDNIHSSYFKKKMNDFFTNQDQELTFQIDELETLEKIMGIKRGCIKGKYANNNLGNFLKKLIDYKLLTSHIDNNNIKRYTTTDIVNLIRYRIRLRKLIEESNNVQIMEKLLRFTLKNMDSETNKSIHYWHEIADYKKN